MPLPSFFVLRRLPAPSLSGIRDNVRGHRGTRVPRTKEAKRKFVIGGKVGTVAHQAKNRKLLFPAREPPLACLYPARHQRPFSPLVSSTISTYPLAEVVLNLAPFVWALLKNSAALCAYVGGAQLPVHMYSKNNAQAIPAAKYQAAQGYLPSHRNLLNRTRHPLEF